MLLILFQDMVLIVRLIIIQSLNANVMVWLQKWKLEKYLDIDK